MYWVVKCMKDIPRAEGNLQGHQGCILFNPIHLGRVRIQYFPGNDGQMIKVHVPKTCHNYNGGTGEGLDLLSFYTVPTKVLAKQTYLKLLRVKVGRH